MEIKTRKELATPRGPEIGLINILARIKMRTRARGGLGCLNRISASISGASARVRLPSGEAAA